MNETEKRRSSRRYEKRKFERFDMQEKNTKHRPKRTNEKSRNW